MSFKAGIPLLTTLDDEDASDEDFAVEISSSTRHRWGRKHLIFSLVIGLVVFLLVAIIISVSVPLVVLRGGSNAGAKTGDNSSSSVPISLSATESISTSSIAPSPSTPSLLLPSPQQQSPSQMSSPALSHSPSHMSSSTLLSPSPSQVTLPPSPTLQPSPSTTTTTTTSVHTPQTTHSPTPTPTPDPINTFKPVTDDRRYKVLTLQNSLRVLLISDPNSNVSAASMEVAAGSFSDPPSAEGLAHFCEHMLFLGTKKYPDEHEYSNYLSLHGGSDNAFTSTQETNYYFTVDSTYLKGALDRFAQFFIAPLFEESSVEGEVHAVNAEHEKNLQSDAWKGWQLLKHISNPSHPFHMFSTGSLSTLNNTRTPLLPLLWTYYNSSYSANTMQLAVYGRDSLSTLTRWVETYFTDIPHRNVSPQTFPSTAFPSTYTQKIVLYYPVADSNTVSIMWQTQPLQSRYRNDVTEFLSHYLGYEGAGSILQFLKKSSWATSLSVGSEVNADSFTILVVNIEMTVEGLSHVSEIVKTVFDFISLLSSQSQSSLLPLWDDHVNISQVVFDYSEPEQPSSYAQSLAQAMRLVQDPVDFLGNPRRFRYNDTLVRKVLRSLSPNNSVVFVGTHHVNFTNNSGTNPPHYGPPMQEGTGTNIPWPDLDQVEPIYSTPFTEFPIPSDLIDYWNSSSMNLQLYLPSRNSFIPSDFDILPPPPNPSDIPVRMNVMDGVSLWWLQDTSFNTPHINMYCTIDASNPNTTSVRWSELTTLYALMASAALGPILYPAKELTYSANLVATPRGLHLQFSGFSDPRVMERLINTTVTNMKNYTRLVEVFKIVQEARLDFLANYKYNTLPYKYIYSYLQQVIMERPYWKHEEEAHEAMDITADEVVEHVMELFSNASFLCFAHGNINRAQVQKYTELIVKALSPTPSPDPATPRGVYQRERVNLTAPGNYSVTLPTLNPSDQNSAVNVVFQIGPACNGSGFSSNCSQDAIVRAAHAGLLAHIVADECFYQLRTVEQLGYVVFCFQPIYSGIASFQVLVQSQEYNASYVLQEIDKFLENFGHSTIGNFTEKTLGKQKRLYASTLRQKSQTLTEESDRLWIEIATGREQFDYSDQILRGLDSVGTESLTQFYSNHITDSDRYRKLIVGVYGADKQVDFSQDSTYCLDWDTLDHTTTLQYPTPDSNCS